MLQLKKLVVCTLKFRQNMYVIVLLAPLFKLPCEEREQKRMELVIQG